MPGPLANAQREKFCQELIAGMTQREAYERAGYQSKTPVAAGNNAWRLSECPEVKARIAELKADAAEKATITQAMVLAELGKIGFANMADYMRVGDDGDPYLDFSALSRDQAAALAEVTVEDFKEGRGENARDVRKVKFKLSDKRAALVDIGKHLGMFTEKVEHTGKDGGPIEMDDLALARLTTFLLTKASQEAS